MQPAWHGMATEATASITARASNSIFSRNTARRASAASHAGPPFSAPPPVWASHHVSAAAQAAPPSPPSLWASHHVSAAPPAHDGNVLPLAALHYVFQQWQLVPLHIAEARGGKGGGGIRR